MDLTEECFTKNTLRFVGNTQWIQSAAPGMSNRTAVPALRTTEGTFPAGSQWTRNTIPACIGTDHYGVGDWCTAPLFKPPVWDIGYLFCLTAMVCSYVRYVPALRFRLCVSDVS